MENSRGTFLAGYYMAYAGTYFNKVLIVSELAEHPDPLVQAEKDRWMGLLKEAGSSFVMQIKQAVNIATHFGIGTPPLPKYPEDYFNWCDETRKQFGKHFPSTSLEGLCFFYGFDMANIASNFSIISTCAEIENNTNGIINKTKQIEHLVQLSLETDFRMASGAILLSRNCQKDNMHAEWKRISELMAKYFPLKGKEVESMNVEALYDISVEMLQETNASIKKLVESL